MQNTSMIRSVFSNWAGHMVFIIGGFILPRLISDHLGQERLGVWDFGWSSVSYFQLLSVGVASAVNRYVAKYRATDQWVEMSTSVSCCACIFTCSAMIGVLITIGLVGMLQRIAPLTFLPYLEEIRILILCLGLTASIDLFMPTYTGVISGSQRYDLLALIESGCYFLLMAMIAILLFRGSGLSFMGGSVLCMRAVEALLKRFVAKKLCPMLRLSISLVRRQEMKKVFIYGSKSMLGTLASMGLYQGSNIIIAYLLGPAAVAVYSRSMALVLNSNKILFHYGRVFVPAASNFQASGDIESLRNLILKGSRNGAFIALPMALVMGFLGKNLLTLWMGSGYSEFPILTILALGIFFSQSQSSTYHILLGMNRHGKASLSAIAGAILSLVISILLVRVGHYGLTGVATSVSVVIAMQYLLIVPRLIKNAVGISISKYFIGTYSMPVLLCLPFAVCLAGTKLLAGQNDLRILGLGISLGGLCLLTTYWMWAIPFDIKRKIWEYVGRY